MRQLHKSTEKLFSQRKDLELPRVLGINMKKNS